MTARQALEEAKRVGLDERRHRYRSECAQQSRCRTQPLKQDPCEWTWCSVCLPLYDNFGRPVNTIVLGADEKQIGTP